jgi:hypothetical protein
VAAVSVRTPLPPPPFSDVTLTVALAPAFASSYRRTLVRKSIVNQAMSAPVDTDHATSVDNTPSMEVV